MKKLISSTLLLSMTAALLSGCSGAKAPAAAETTAETSVAETVAETSIAETSAATTEEGNEEPVTVNIMALKGPTAMGMVRFMDNADNRLISDHDYQFTIAAAIDEVTPKLVQGSADIAAVPANLASVLYNNTEGGIRVLAINTLGVLYIVESGDTIQSVEDLRGKTIYASGKGATPEYALNYILSGNGIDPTSDVTIEWKSEHAECLAALTASENTIAMLPQPFVTTAQMKAENIRTALDLTEEWDALESDAEAPSALITGVVVARAEFIEEHPEAVAAFLNHYKDSVDYVNGNLSEGAALIGRYDIVPETVALKAISACNITFIAGDEMKEKLSGYLTALLEQNPASVGGALPGDDFYYQQ